ncbi:helix-turn-helix transcriptional regulator [Marinomonas transparens]|uniref:Helix-turn-helix transcriptional regulator n=1 Tax=Marinomonas transparens TaxID=2795388 RepID=A0A934JS25_9GAMM|nr:AraC family transcriptional regulator [Marinomonas transparens]MBJ7536375.1 helix-turn-helix transcriptional regulator [Marinomonas transparens]
MSGSSMDSSQLEQGVRHQHLQLQKLPSGIELLTWSGECEEIVERHVRDDSQTMHFSYWLKGGVEFELKGDRQKAFSVKPGTGSLGRASNGEREGYMRQQGEFAHLSVIIDPEKLACYMAAESTESAATPLFETGYKSVEMHTTALSLFHALTHAQHNRPNLWLEAKSLEFISLFQGMTPVQSKLNATDRQKLYQARDLLLAHLDQPPTIEQLARASGLNTFKLKTGFKICFGTSIYGLFQQERMQQAMTLLKTQHLPVGVVANRLGYSNVSHFAKAFKKQFNFNPSEVKSTGMITKS